MGLGGSTGWGPGEGRWLVQEAKCRSFLHDSSDVPSDDAILDSCRAAGALLAERPLKPRSNRFPRLLLFSGGQNCGSLSDLVLADHHPRSCQNVRTPFSQRPSNNNGKFGFFDEWALASPDSPDCERLHPAA